MTINADSQNVYKWRKLLISVYLFWKKKWKIYFYAWMKGYSVQILFILCASILQKIHKKADANPCNGLNYK